MSIKPLARCYTQVNLRTSGFQSDFSIDVNLSMDKNKLEYIASRPGGERLIQTLLAGQPEVGIPRVVNRFGLKDLVKPAMGIESLASLLFYSGMVTVQGRTKTGELHLQIPNLVTRGLYFEQLREMLLPNELEQDEGRATAKLLWQAGEMQPL